MEQFSKLGPVAALSKLWSELTAAQRVVVTTFALLSIVMLTLGVSALTKPKMAVLFSGLSPEDAGAITQKLSEAKIEYELTGQDTISVPESIVYQTKLQMATQGLPQGSTAGFSLFDKSTFGMTEFMEKVDYQRAVEGELTRTICCLAPVISARVHLVMPEDSPFVDEQQPATASVQLKLRRGTPLGDEQVGAVIHLVSSAVKGLKPENVTITDTDGNVLAEGPAMKGGGGLMTSNQSKLKRQYETDIAQNLQKMLAKTVGPDKVSVTVCAELAFDQTETQKVVFQPANPATVETGPDGQKITREARGIKLREDTKTEKYQGAVVPMGGAVTAATPRGSVTTTPSGPNDSYDLTQSTAEYGVGKVVEQTVKAPGTIKRLSVAVLVDETVPVTSIGVIKEAVRAAAGIDEKPPRNDMLTVEKIKFDQTAKQAAAKEMDSASKSELMMAIAKNAGAAVLLIVFLIFLSKIIKQIKMPVTAAAVAPKDELPVPAANLPNPADLLGSMGISAQPAPTPQPVAEYIPPKPESVIPPEITNSNPEELARLVRSWMSEQ